MVRANNLILAADFGTGSLKLGLFDDQAHLRCVAPDDYTYSTLSRKPGWAEQNPKDWWTVFKKALRDTFKKFKLNGDAISCISIGAHMGLVCLDKNGKPLRPAILFFDQRSTPQCRKIELRVTPEELMAVCGNRIAPIQSAAQMMWIRDSEPEIFKVTSKFSVATGYLGYLLTGEYSYDWTHASWTLLFDIYRHEWSGKMADLLEIPYSVLPPSKPSWEILGYVTFEAAKETGLVEGTTVLTGGSDTPLAALAEGVINVNDTLLTAGSVSSVLVCQDKPVFSLKLLNRCHVVPDRWLTQGAMNVHGSAVRWFLEEFCKSMKSEAAEKGVNPFRLLDGEVEKSPVGSKNLIFLPYLTGERAPIWDPYARGVLFGLSFAHGRGDVARAIYEGTSYAVRHNLEAIEEMGLKVSDLKVSGQGARSKVWNQIRADILGKSVRVSMDVDSSLIGCAELARYGMGWVKDFSDLHRNRVEETYTPRTRYNRRYSRLFQIYKRTYSKLRDEFRELQKGG